MTHGRGINMQTLQEELSLKITDFGVEPALKPPISIELQSIVASRPRNNSRRWGQTGRLPAGTRAGASQSRAQIRYLDQTSQLIKLAPRDPRPRERLDRNGHEPGVDRISPSELSASGRPSNPLGRAEPRTVLLGQG